ncbi:MAG: hypothetical protein GX100_09680 [candidate division WS1 bacterium]|jgi:hypothetical protein|nr:hypothetical protein [candidate division WS1 bacterium]
MIWYYLGEFVAMLVLAALELSWAPWLKLGGAVAPKLVLVAVVLVGLFRGPLEGAWSGMAGALCVAALGALPMGGLFVAYMGCGIFLGILGQTIFPNRLLLLMLTVFLAVLVAGIVGLIFAPPPVFGSWLGHLFLEALYSAVLTVPLVWLARLVLPVPAPPLPVTMPAGPPL